MNIFFYHLRFLLSELFLVLFLSHLISACSKPEVQKSDLIVCQENGIRVEFKGYLFCVYEFNRSTSQQADVPIDLSDIGLIGDMRVDDMRVSDMQGLSSLEIFEQEVSSLCEAPLNHASFEWNDDLYILFCSSINNPPKVLLDAVYQEAKNSQEMSKDQGIEMIEIEMGNETVLQDMETLLDIRLDQAVDFQGFDLPDGF
jgi:hypothetical protein